MPRIARIKVKGAPTVYHIISRTALDGYVIGDVEKDFLMKMIKRLSKLYFAEIIGLCLMSTHIHILCRMHVGNEYSDEDIRKRKRSLKRLRGLTGYIPSNGFLRVFNHPASPFDTLRTSQGYAVTC